MSFMTGYILGGIAAESAAHTKETVLNFQRHRQNQRTAQSIASWQQHAANWEASARDLDDRVAYAQTLLIEADQQLAQAAADRQALEQWLAEVEALAAGWETSARRYHGMATSLDAQNTALRQQLQVEQVIHRAVVESMEQLARRRAG